MYSSPNRARERTPIHRGVGVTDSEKYLKQLCERSFLSLWSYPGIFRDQGKATKGDGKEICDLLIIFGEHVLIFSDKYCDFPSSDSLDLDWQRWYKRAIQKSAAQAWGAERWLKNHPNRVFLDQECKQPFPLPIPEPESAKYHIIVVAHGCEVRCENEFGGRGSLMLSSVLEFNNAKPNGNLVPFTIGDLDKNKTFVHVLNDSTLSIVLATLDTVTDFTNYLDKKVNLFRSSTAVFASGEEDLLAFYLKDINEDGEHDFVFSESADAIFLEEGHWENFCRRPERIEQLRQNEISYLWDELIKRFSHHALNATQYFTNHTELSSTEIALRFMASQSRFERRIISKRLQMMYTNTPDGTKRVGAIVPKNSPGGPYFVFLALPQPDFLDTEEYRRARGLMLEACCMVIKLKFPDAQDIIGIASEPYRKGGSSSEDLAYLDAREWTPEQNEEAIRLQSELKIFNSPTMEHIHEEEYPDPPNFNRKIGRNERCPCGSGKKYKHCHGE